MSKKRALERVIEEIKERTGTLNLGGLLPLAKVPKEILALTHLQSLDLRLNEIRNISFLKKFDWLGKFRPEVK